MLVSRRKVYSDPNRKLFYFTNLQSFVGNVPKILEANLIWTAIMLPKQRFIVWLAYQERLLTKERLRLNINIDNNKCCLCEEDQDETQIHMFAECRWIDEVKSKFSSWIGIAVSMMEI